MRRPLLVLLGLVLLLLLPCVALAAPKPTFDQAINTLISRGWPQTVDNHLAYMPGTNPQLGFYLGGTWSDNARARYIAAQMKAIGLKNVHLEPVPLDVYDFKSASVAVGTNTMIASTYAGTSPTPASGLTAQVVYAHEGTAADFNALAASGVDVRGKIVLLDADPNNWWMNDPQAEAGYRGAIGAIFTFGPTTAPYWTFADDALTSFDSECDLTDVPGVYISKQDGDWLRGQLAANDTGPTVTMKLNEKVTLSAKGGRGYNVFGDLPGKVKDSTFVLFGAHHDAYFHSGTDDTDGCVDNLLIAKAMVKSGYRPSRTVRFMFTTGEEYGMVNSYNDWCIGAWWAITHTHPKWAGRIRAFLNTDHFFGTNRVTMRSAELAPMVSSLAAASSSLLPNGYRVQAMSSSTWQDNWSLEMAGVPFVHFTNKEDNSFYHTNYMTPYKINWPYTGGIAKFIFRVEKKVNNSGLLPYGLVSRADDLAGTVVPAGLLAAGANAGAVNRLQTDVSALQAAAAQYEARAASIPAAHVKAVNRSLLQIWKKFNVELLGLTPYQGSVYRHEQSLLDVQSLNQAIAALKQASPDTAAALAGLGNVDWTSVGLMLSHDVYLHLLTRLDPGYKYAAWGSQANPVWPLVDVIPQYNAIKGGTWDAQTVADLQAMRDQDLTDLNKRLNAMSAALEQITPRIAALN